MSYQSLWLQSVLGLSPIKAGLVVLPCAACAFAASAAVGRVSRGLPASRHPALEGQRWR